MITIYAANETDFSSLGLGTLAPTKCTVYEESGGAYELELEQPVDNTLRYAELKQFRIIRAPVPARETPLLAETTATTSTVTVNREIYKVNVSSRLRLRVKPNTSSKVVGSYKNGTRVIVLEKTSSSWYKVAIEKGGASGYMSTSYLQYVETKTDTITTTTDTPGNVVQVEQSRDQLFRIETVEADTKENKVFVTAKHITYDLAGAIVSGEYSPENIAASEVCAQLVGKMDHSIEPFEIYCKISTQISGDYGGKCLLECLFDEETGVAAQCKARVFRDNYTIYILPDETRDIGMEIRYGKNLLSAAFSTDISEVVTRIKPVGRDKNGENLYITENNGFVDSSHIDDYPIIYAQQIEYDVVEGNGLSKTAARAKLKELAQKDFDSGIDMPKVSLNSEFVRLELSERYRNLANAYSLHLYDSAKIIADDFDVNTSVRMVKYKFDCIREQYEKTELGDITSTSANVYGYEIRQASLDGNRLISNTVLGDKLRNLSIQYAKISNAAVESLSADSITAITAYIENLNANHITTDALYAALAELDVAQITTANMQAANIDWASIDELNSAIVDALHVEADTGSFTVAEITNLLAAALILDSGVAGSMEIKNLSVTSANLVSAIISDLVLKGTDNKYYSVAIDTDGVIRAKETTLTESEIAAGETDSGKSIVETGADIKDLDSEPLNTNTQILSDVFIGALGAGKITATQAMIASATIPQLYAAAINAAGNSMTFTANQTINFLLGEANTVGKWFTFSDDKGLIIKKPAYVDSDGVEHPESIWSTVTDETGYHIKRSDKAGYVASFARDRLAVDGVEIGEIVTRKTSSGGWVWTD